MIYKYFLEECSWVTFKKRYHLWCKMSALHENHAALSLWSTKIGLYRYELWDSQYIRYEKCGQNLIIRQLPPNIKDSGNCNAVLKFQKTLKICFLVVGEVHILLSTSGKGRRNSGLFHHVDKWIIHSRNLYSSFTCKRNVFFKRCKMNILCFKRTLRFRN
jgi:hypothetical protein